MVAEYAVGFADMVDVQGPAFMGTDTITPGEPDARQWRGLFRINTRIAGRQKKYRHGTMFDAQDRSQTQLQFTGTYPALSRCEIAQGHVPILAIVGALW